MIVMISGRMGSGKTTLALALENAIKTSIQSKVIQTRFAEVIYEIHDECRLVLSKYDIEVPKEKDGDLLQYLGTEWGRKKYGEDIWCKTTKSLVDQLEKKFPQAIIIISDCRFKNEFDYFSEALRIRLVCDRDIRKSRCESWRDKENHPSEIDLDEWENEFDLKFDTGVKSVEECVSEILYEISTRSFMGRRKNG